MSTPATPTFRVFPRPETNIRLPPHPADIGLAISDLRRERPITGSTISTRILLSPRKEEGFATEPEIRRKPLVWTAARSFARDAFSEFFGVFVFLLFSFGSIAQVVLSNGEKGTYTSIVLGWGVGITLGAYVAGKSGGHLNPGVTLSMCVFRRFPWRKLPVYALAQILGAFAAAGVVYANYIKAIDAFEGGPGIRTVPGFSKNATAGIFATYPAPVIAGAKASQFFSEFIPSSILVFVIFALTDEGNIAAGKLTPVGLGLTFVGITACFGWETAFALNLARDFGPRLLTYCVGYGTKVWTADGHYFWIPMVAPFAGCIFGALLYDVFVYEGESPINTPWMGLRQIVRPGRKRTVQGANF